MYHLFLLYSLTHEKSFQLEILTQSEMQRSMMVQDGCEVLYDFPSKMWAFFVNCLGDKKKRKIKIAERDTNKQSFLW